MFKGIRLFLIFNLLASIAYAKTPDELMRVCMGVNGKVQQSGGEYKKDGQTCVKMRCNYATSSAGGISSNILEDAQPDGEGGFVGAWQEVCKQSTDWIAEFNNQYKNNIDVDVKGGVDVDVDVGRGGGGFYIDGRLVGRAEWERECVKKNGKIRRKCRRGKNGSYSYYYNGGGKGGGGGGSRYDGYVVIRKADGSTFQCEYTRSWDDCLSRGGSGSVVVSVNTYDDHCVSCENNGRGGGGGVLSGIADIAGAILPPLAYLGSNWLWSDAYLGANQAWAGAAQVGFEQCQIMQTNHIQSMYGNGTTDMQGYFSNNELPYEYIAPPGCNGYNVNAFAGGMGFMGNGMGGFGHPWMGAGYSPGFVGGMYGPYGQYNPYGNGMGMGMGMGYPGMGGMGYPGMGGGIGINLGLGMGGMGMGGMGYPGMGGMGGMYPGMGGGMGGMYPGMGGGIGIGGGMGGMGYPGMGGMGGFPGGGIGVGINGGIGGGFHGNPWGAGAGGMGTVPWGNGAGSYWNGSGGWNGGGGWGNQYGGNFGNIQQSYALNQQALAQGSYYQQAALQNSYNQSAQNLWSVGYGGGMGGGMGGYGYAPYAPSNMGLSMNLGWGFGF